MTSYDYAALCRRIDPVHAPADLDQLGTDHIDVEALARGDHHALLAIVGGTFQAMCVDDETAAIMTGIVRAALAHLRSATGSLYASLLEAPTLRPTDKTSTDHLIDFIEHDSVHDTTTTAADGAASLNAGPDLRSNDATIETLYLRRNAIHAARLALHLISPATHRPAPIEVPTLTRHEDALKKSRKDARAVSARRGYADRRHWRNATHDEVITLRLAASVHESQRGHHLCSSVIALATSCATSVEIPLINWTHLDGDQLTLAGIHRPDAKNIALRTITLDPWALGHLTARRDVLAIPLNGQAPIGPMTFTGTDPHSNSAQVSTDTQFKNAAKTAGLATTETLTFTSLSLWAAIKNAHDAGTAAQAAHRHGKPLTVLHNRVHQLSDRTR